MRRVVDVQQEAEARAGAGGEPDLRVDGDVVTLIRTGRRRRAAPSPAGGVPPPPPRPEPRPAAAAAAAAASRSRASEASRSSLRGGTGQIVEDARRADDRRLHRRRIGTLITSSRKRAVFGSSIPPSTHPGTSSADRTPAVPET